MRRVTLSVVASALAAAGAGLPPRTAVHAAPSGRPTCCYTNPQYSGICVVQAGEGETCASIRAYLNNPRSLGKTYCERTMVRGGWKQAKCARH
jgi:hypothetical protein